MRCEQIVDAFEAGAVARAGVDAAEIRLLASAAALVATPSDADVATRRRVDIARRSLIADLATATRMSEWTVARLVGEAADLCERFGAGVTALEQGRISRRHLAVIYEAGRTIVDDDARGEFLTAAIDRAADTTPTRLSPIVAILAERLQTEPLQQRVDAARDERRIEVVDHPNSMSTLSITDHAVLIHGIFTRITEQARSVIEARTTDPADSGELEDTRTPDQIRVDVVTDLLLTAGPSESIFGDGLAAIRPTVQITVPVLTATGYSREPALLAGVGPIDARTARALAESAPVWERVMTSPTTGEVLAVDRYRPTSGLARFVRARDERCRFPGCRRPVWKCDLDHTIPHSAGGPTSACNLAGLCRGHHMLKTHSAWTVEQIRPGVLVWTSPSGRKHTDLPDAVVRFVPDPDVLDRRRILDEPWLFPSPPPGHPGAAPF